MERCLLRHGVSVIFGYPGGAIMPFYDVLYDSPIRHILTIHEQGAVHAADGYARASGQVGVCIATSGPGATNLVTGLATAFLDSSPVIAITGQVATALLGSDAFQEVDIISITMPVTKHNFLVRNINSLPSIIDQAFMLAASGRPGPVLIDVPRDVLTSTAEYYAVRQKAAWNTVPAYADKAAIKAAAAALAKARQPVMLIGGGVKTGNACAEVLDFVRSTRIPVVSTLMGLDAFPAGQPYFLGLTGMHGHKTANLAVHHADVVLAVGSRFSDRITGDINQYSQGKTIIHCDVDPAECGKNISTDVTVVGGLKYSLLQLTKMLQPNPWSDIHNWWQKIEMWRQNFLPVYDDKTLNPPWIMNYLSAAAADFPVTWVTDVGQHQMWAAQYLKISSPRSWITAGGLGTMGFGLPAALGAQAATPDKRVILIAGDGGFKMTGMELHTAVDEGLPVICIIFNNKSLGMVHQWQHLFFNRRYMSTELSDFDFTGFATVNGAAAFSAKTPRQFKKSFQAALAANKPAVIVADIEPDLLVSPMVSPGQPINRFVNDSCPNSG
ncbi:MAG: biosynthetic-type acetolactate synthase large subunit [Veillonellales bacterium]